VFLFGVLFILFQETNQQGERASKKGVKFISFTRHSATSLVSSKFFCPFSPHPFFLISLSSRYLRSLRVRVLCRHDRDARLRLLGEGARVHGGADVVLAKHHRDHPVQPTLSYFVHYSSSPLPKCDSSCKPPLYPIWRRTRDGFHFWQVLS
jgi:hypothetical protein